MSRVVRVTDYGSHGWYLSVCDKCNAEIGLSAALFTLDQAATARCFVCDPVPKGTIEFVPEKDDDFATDADLRAIDDNYDRERTLAELSYWNAFHREAYK